MMTKQEISVMERMSRCHDEKIAADTNILIRKAENPKLYSDIFRGKQIIASNFTILEFRRTILRYCVSLYNFLRANNDMMLVYEEIRKMKKIPKKSRESEGWEIILKIIGHNDYPYIMGILTSFIRNALFYRFRADILFFDTKSNCGKKIKADEITKNSFVVDIECADCDAFINYNRNDLINIRNGLTNENEFIGIIPLLDKIIKKERINNEDCALLGDIIISLDNPDDVALLTLDCKHIKPICDCINKPTFC